jgi:hypothetical protein
MDPDHPRPSRPGPSPHMNRGARAVAALSGEPGIPSAPAPRASPRIAPRCRQPARHRPVLASCRDASGLAVLMSTGRRAGLPGLSRPAAPAPPLARLVRITGPGRQIDIFSHRQLQRWAAGYREHQGLGQPGRQSRSREWTAARQVGRVTHRAAWSDALACSRGRGQRTRVGFRLCSCGEAAKAAGRWMLQDCPRPPGRLPPGDLPGRASVSTDPGR